MNWRVSCYRFKKKNLFKEWSFHVTSTQQVQLTSNPSELNTIGKEHRHIKMFPEMQTYIQTGPNMAALLWDVLPAAFVHMREKWLHTATCLLCARGAWAMVCARCQVHCSVWGKSQPQVLVETREEHCSNTAGLANCLWGWCFYKKQPCMTGTTTSKLGKNCRKRYLTSGDLQSLQMLKQFQRWIRWCLPTHWITISDVANELVISHESAQVILTEEWQVKWDEMMDPATQQCPKYMAMAMQQFLVKKQNALIP